MSTKNESLTDKRAKADFTKVAPRNSEYDRFAALDLAEPMEQLSVSRPMTQRR